jgi:hypothetical protein
MLAFTLVPNRFLLLIAFLVSVSPVLHAQQVVISEDFEDEDLSQNPEWTGDLDNYSFTEENENILLKLDDSEASGTANRSQIRAESASAYGSWEFFYRPGTNPTNANRSFFFLVSDNENINIFSPDESSVNGYAVRTGESGDSPFRLVRVNNGSQTVITSSETIIQEDQGYQVKVTREENGDWQIHVSEGYGSTPQPDSPIESDNEFTTSNWFGILSVYSSGNAQNFFYDNIIISETAEDLLAEYAELTSANQLDVTFNRDIDAAAIAEADFVVDEIGNPVSAELTGGNVVRLIFEEPFENGSYNLSISNVQDTSGETIEPGTEIGFTATNPFEVIGFEPLDRNMFEITFSQDVGSFTESDFEVTGFGAPDNVSATEPGIIRITYNNPIDVGEQELVISNITSAEGWLIETATTISFFLFDPYEDGDLVISEFYYRVPVSWRTNEFDRPQYVEIHNRTDKLLNLRNFTINDQNISIDQDLPIDGGDYLVITRGVPVFEDRFGERNFTEADEFPVLSLTTSGSLVFKTDGGDLIEELTYTASSWGGNETALERYSFDAPAGFRDNWAESEDVLTGSPGLPNTVTLPADPPEAVEASFPAPRTLRITFSRTLSEEVMDELSDFGLDNHAVIHSAEFTTDERTLEFELDDQLEDLFEYTFTYQNAEDIFGNEIPGRQEFMFTFQNPFRILEASLEDETTLRVRFTLPMQTSTVAETDFELAGGTQPLSISFSDSETAELEFAEPFDVGGHQVIVSDIASTEPAVGDPWELEENSVSEFFRFDEYQPGDIVLNEFMYRPPDDYPRYVELHNRSGRFLNLKDWELRRAEGAGSNGGTISGFDLPIEPGGFIVITNNEEELTDIFGSGPWVHMDNYPGLTQTVADRLRLIDNKGELVEFVDYDPPVWGGNRVALERRQADLPANSQENWGESPNELLGTPGKENEVEGAFDLAVSDAEVITRSLLRVEFNADIDENSVLPENFSVNGILPESASSEEPNEVFLEFGSNLPNGGQTLLISNVKTPGGFEIESGYQFSFTVFDDYQDGDIVITEFMYRPPSEYPRYVEIHNISNRLLNLREWELRRQDGAASNGGVFTGEDLAIAPGEYVVITNNEEELTDIFGSGPWVHMDNYPGLTQTVPDQIRLINSHGSLVESVSYDPSDWGGNGVALERRSMGVPAHDVNNWAESAAELLGTPGEENSAGPADEGPQLVGAVTTAVDTVTVTISGALDHDAISAGNFSISGGLSVEDVEFANSVNARLVLDSKMSFGTTYTITVSGIPDIFGNILEEASTSFTYYEFGIAEPGDVVISEFMYNEPAGYTRYIELYNNSHKAFDLAGWQQANDTGTRRTLTSSQAVLPPGSYMVILPNEELLSVFPDISYINAGGRLSALKNGGDNIVIVNPEGVVIDSLSYSPDWGGDGVALERRRAGRPSGSPDNWGESPNELLGTPGAPNEVDSEFNLTITSLRAVSRRVVEVVFNTGIRSEDASAGNFSVNGENPSEVLSVNSRELLLEFGSDLPAGEQTLTISSVQTEGGFRIDDGSEFLFTVFDEFEEGDIVINEFMYRPPGGYALYVELFNNSGKLLNLRDWRLQRRQVSTERPRKITSADLLIQPGDYLVLTDDAGVMTDIYGDRNYFEMSDFPSFTVTVSDQIRLFTNTGALADSLEYHPSDWGGNNVSLERLSPDVPATLSENWEESPNEMLGTPGLPNDARPDGQPPVLLSAAQFEDQGFRLEFSRQLDSETATDRSNYSITPAVSISVADLTENEVFLMADDELINDQVYEISVSSISDVFGNEMEPAAASVRYLDFSEVRPQQIVINEILYRRSETGSPEFVEIYNRTDQNFDLSGWSLSDASGKASIPPGTAIRGNDYLVFTDTGSFAAGSDRIVYLPGFRSLSNTAGAVVLRNENDAVIDSVFYEGSWYNNPAGISLERKDPFALSFDPANWAMSSDERGSTPAEENSRFEPDETPPEIVFANIIHPDSIEVILSEFVDIKRNGGREIRLAADVAGPDMLFDSHEPETRILISGAEADLLSYDPMNGNRIVLDGSDVNPGEEITLVIENLGDFQGNVSAKAEQPVAQPVSEGDLVFNEIMYNPISENRDGMAGQSEYIEIYNRRPYAISMEGLFLHDEPDNNGEITRIDPASSETRWIPASGYALFYPEPGESLFTESRTATFFEISDEFEQFALRTNRTTLSLPNTGRPVYLADSTQAVIDMVDYSPDWHNPNLVDTRGIALERINPGFGSNDPSNWGSSATIPGGTPGVKNSIYQESELAAEKTGVVLSPNPFSPDGSGHEDNLFISYHFDEPDYLLRIRIYDRYGRLVRNLVEGKNAGFEGSVIWDGRTDDGKQNRIGIYIVLVEATNSSNGNNRTFRETAVIARQF